MGISGRLEDVSVADVMQFIHLGLRSGTLFLEHEGRTAEISFSRGGIIRAFTPGTLNIGDRLLAENVIDRDTLLEAVRVQNESTPHRALGVILTEMGAVTAQVLRKVVEAQIEETIYELVTWTRGTFRFEVDDLRPIDDIARYPGDILPDLNLDTQAVLMEGMRIFDEKNRSAGEEGGGDAVEIRLARERRGEPEGARPEIRQDAQDLQRLERGLELLDELMDEPPQRQEMPDFTPPPPLPRLHLVSDDEGLMAGLESALSPDLVSIVRVDVRNAGTVLPGDTAPIVLLDVGESLTPERIQTFRLAHPRSQLIAAARDPASAPALYEAGVSVVVPPDVPTLAACVKSQVQQRGGALLEFTEDRRYRAGFAKLRRVLAEIRSGLLSTTMALNLLHIISESVERAVFFLVKQDGLVAMGAFGFTTSDNVPLAEVTKGVVIPLSESNALTRAVSDGKARSLAFDEANLNGFGELVGQPRSGQIVVFPVLGSDRVISVVYTDNGSHMRAIEEIEVLDLAAAQVGMAFENELLRRKLLTTTRPQITE